MQIYVEGREGRTGGREEGRKAAVTCSDQMLLTAVVWGINEAETKTE